MKHLARIMAIALLLVWSLAMLSCSPQQVAQETTTQSMGKEEREFKESIKLLIEEVYQGTLIECGADYKTLTIAYNTSLLSENDVLKEMYAITTGFKDNRTNVDLSATTKTGDIYHTYTSDENMMKIAIDEMSYEDWLGVAVK